MPRLNHRLLVDKNRDDLRILIEELFFYVSKAGGLDKIDKVASHLLKNLFSFYKRIGELNQQEINIIWESAKELSETLLKSKADDIIEKQKRNNQVDKEKPLYGKYWIFPGDPAKYIKCEDHVEYAIKNGNEFIDLLGVDAYDYLHAVNSGRMNVIQLIFSAGGIMADFVMEGKRKVGRFQLSQTSLPWLKSKLNKMPIYRSHVRVIDHTEKYKGPQSGIYFSFLRTIK